MAIAIKCGTKKNRKNMSHGKDQKHLFKFDVAIMRHKQKTKKKKNKKKLSNTSFTSSSTTQSVME